MRLFCTAMAWCLAFSVAVAQETPAKGFVSKQEHEKLKQEMEALKQQMQGLTQDRSRRDAELDEALDDLELGLQSVKDSSQLGLPGSTKFLITGYGFAGFKDKEDGDSSFDARFFPIFLWQLSDRLMFEGEIEVELDDSSSASTGSSDKTKVVLEFMDIAYIANDFLTIKAGKPLHPLSTFKQQFHSAWINKLPDQPLFATGGARLIPTSMVGLIGEGAFAVGPTELNYSTWISNAPRLVTTGSKTGQLNFSNFSDTNNNKAIGARLGFFPIPEFEAAYAFMWADVGASGTSFGDVDALVQVASFTFVKDCDPLKGVIDTRAEFVWSDVDDVDYGSGVFDNQRSGGYVQLAYRATKVDGPLKNFEPVLRWDYLFNPSDATGSAKAYDEERVTLGMNYYLSPSTVVKVAWQWDDVDDPQGSARDTDAFLLQFAMGF